MGRRDPMQHDRRGEHRVERHAQHEAPEKDAMHPVVSVDRQQRRRGRGCNRHHTLIPAEDRVQPMRRQYAVSDVEAQEREQRADQHHGDAAKTELRARLDHLWQPEFGPLGSMKGDEHGSKQNAERPRERRVAEAQAHARTDEADRDAEEMEIRQEPERYLVRHPSVAFALVDVVDGFVLHRQASRVSGTAHYCVRRPAACNRLLSGASCCW